MNDSDLGIEFEDSELDSLLQSLITGNDGDPVISNDVDNVPIIVTNDVDEPFSISDPCHVVIENVNGALKVGTQIIANVGESHEVSICDFKHLVTWTARGSFIIDVLVDYPNRQLNKSDCDYIELNPNESITLTESTGNIRFNSEKSGERAFIVFDVVALPVKEEPAPPVVNPCIADDNCLTSIADIRRFVLDRMIEDNEIDLELFFSDAEIIAARRLAVANYNELPPYVDKIQLNSCNQDCLPAPVMFLNGIAYQLYLTKLQKLHKEDVEYQAGGMTVNIIKKRIAYITSTIKIFKDEFIGLASARKTHINYSSAFGRVG